VSAQSKWQVRVTGSLRAYFKQPDGTSRPGIDWAVSLTSNSKTKRILVRAYDEAVINGHSEQAAQLVLRYVVSLLDSGWSPDDYKSTPGELIYFKPSH
jgi:hypothetical protein